MMKCRYDILWSGTKFELAVCSGSACMVVPSGILTNPLTKLVVVVNQKLNQTSLAHHFLGQVPGTCTVTYRYRSTILRTKVASPTSAS
jgi:DNA-binding beta-propeller fold protein YncE